MSQSQSAAIIIAAYNAEVTIARAVRSALDQAGVSEVCVIDDASTDATIAAAQGADDGTGRLIIIRQDANAGPSAARNSGLAATTAPWIGVLDADDYFLPGRIATLLNHTDGADLIADVLLRKTESQAEPAPPPWQDGQALRIIGFEEFVLGNLGQSDGPLDLGFIKPLFRRAFLDRHNIRYRTEMRLGEDYELYARALGLGGVLKLTPPAGYISVEREGSLSKKHSETDLKHLRDCDDDLMRLPGLTPPQVRALQRHRASVDCRYQWREMINAVKAKNLGAALRTFTSPRVAAFLAARLAEQVWLRGTGRFRRG